MHGSDIIDVCRGGGIYDTIRTEDLVPGDVIIIPSSGQVICFCLSLFIFLSRSSSRDCFSGKGVEGAVCNLIILLAFFLRPFQACQSDTTK